MFYHDSKLAYTVKVDKPNPLFAKMLQQAIGGVEGEIRVMLQYLFQAWGARGPTKYRDMLLNTGTEEIGHIEMLATAVALNLEGAPLHYYATPDYFARHLRHNPYGSGWAVTAVGQTCCCRRARAFGYGASRWRDGACVAGALERE